MDKILEAAKAVASARRDLVPLRPLDQDLAPRDEAEGYRIQDAVHAVLAGEVGPLVGYKIGCTSAVMQRYLGIPHPCGGGVFSRGVHSSGVSLRHADYIRVTTVKTVLGDVKFGKDGEWAEARVLQVQFQNVKGNDPMQFKDAATQVVVAPAAYESGNAVK